MNKASISPDIGESDQVDTLCLTSRKICRICLDDDPKGFISPCECSGSAQFTHKKCLKSWILCKFPTGKEAFCEICKYKLNIQTVTRWKCEFIKNSYLRSLYLCRIKCLLLIILISGGILGIIIEFYVMKNGMYMISVIILSVCVVILFLSLGVLALCFFRLFVNTDNFVIKVRPKELDKSTQNIRLSGYFNPNA
ncbi:hypothetical protein SteCoe_2487 [Stentor coeruleus]|uniref:RING-CH-type domain-containing protein n=1 Tax=Stentor coeruleus TaxID=5963 RepID=A0A1R2CZM2_9CILI|nr:hypothetical protein SteCoe_2487 [Stentor coeruleus]